MCVELFCFVGSGDDLRLWDAVVWSHPRHWHCTMPCRWLSLPMDLGASCGIGSCPQCTTPSPRFCGVILLPKLSQPFEYENSNVPSKTLIPLWAVGEVLSPMSSHLDERQNDRAAIGTLQKDQAQFEFADHLSRGNQQPPELPCQS